MHFSDLSHYAYLLPTGLAHVLTVGWLHASQAYPRGTVRAATLEKLKRLVLVQPAMQTRGHSACEVCGRYEVELVAAQGARILGSAEVWVPDSQVAGRVYAAPDLVVHYIEAHSYRPPIEFLASVDAVDATLWNGADVASRVLDQHFRAKRSEPGGETQT